jgi:hypothetical protein
VEKSSGNVFTDLGLPHPEQELLKAKLTLQISKPPLEGAALAQCYAMEYSNKLTVVGNP